nr:nucleolar protein 58-like [Dermatophagoides farinae]
MIHHHHQLSMELKKDLLPLSTTIKQQQDIDQRISTILANIRNNNDHDDDDDDDNDPDVKDLEAIATTTALSKSALRKTKIKPLIIDSGYESDKDDPDDDDDDDNRNIDKEQEKVDKKIEQKQKQRNHKTHSERRAERRERRRQRRERHRQRRERKKQERHERHQEKRERRQTRSNIRYLEFLGNHVRRARNNSNKESIRKMWTKLDEMIDSLKKLMERRQKTNNINGKHYDHNDKQLDEQVDEEIRKFHTNLNELHMNE